MSKETTRFAIGITAVFLVLGFLGCVVGNVSAVPKQSEYLNTYQFDTNSSSFVTVWTNYYPDENVTCWMTSFWSISCLPGKLGAKTILSP